MQYDVVIGLEVHVQIRTQSKMFCCCPNRYGADPNTLICPVCMGYPGVLPVANEEAIKKTILSGLMCNCQIATYSKFDRKSYFYPDMPKNYQISQYDLPLCVDGRLEVSGKGLSGVQLHPREIGITRIHLEEDVGKSIHLSHCSGIDFNRAGVPLMEIVSEPDITSPDEAYAYLIALKQIMKYAEISDCDMEKGQMRCDVNISLMPTGAEDFNPKTEVKNLNSFRAVHRALQFEIERQSEVLNNGDTTQQETRGWNDDSGETYVLRKKESAHDYRYFPEPDLMPLQITADLLEVIRKSIPETPGDRKKRLVSDYNIPEYDAAVLTLDKDYADYFESCIKLGANPKKISNWIMAELLREISLVGISMSACPIKPVDFVSLIKLIDSGSINGKIAKMVFVEMFSTGKGPEEIVNEKGLTQVTDTSEILNFVKQAIEANPQPVQQVKEGKATALNFLVGQVMKLSRGKANPQLAAEALKNELGTR